MTSAATSAGIANVYVYVYNSSGGYVAYGYTNSSGDYTTSTTLATGTYYLLTSNSSGYIDEQYDNKPCVGFGCTITSGTGVSVTSGSVTAGINFALDAGALVSGKVTAAVGGAAIPNTYVYVTDGAVSYRAYASTDSAGNFTTFTGLTTGTYYIYTRNPGGYIDELYDNLVCSPSCTYAAGTPVTLTAGTTKTGINFALDTGGKVGGKVTDAVTGAALNGVTVYLYATNGNYLTSATTDSSGNYLTAAQFPNGSVLARTSNYIGYLDEVYDNLPCGPSCNVSVGKPIATAVGTTATADFALNAGGKISGTVTASDTSGPLVGLNVDIYNAAGTYVTSATTNSTGAYVTSVGLATGNYYAITSNGSSFNYLNEGYNNVICGAGCSIYGLAPIAVTAGATTSGINFALDPAAKVVGRVTDAVSGAGIGSVTVSVYSNTVSFFANASTNSTGHFTVQGQLPTGSYFVRTTNFVGYLDELHNNQPCVPGCTMQAGAPVALTAGATTTVDFALDRGGKITGTVTNASSGAALAGVSVTVYDTTGYGVTTASTNASGMYELSGPLPTGTYYVRTSNAPGFLNEQYDDQLCSPACNFELGKPVAVTAGATTSGINFALSTGGTITGKVTAAAGGAAISGIYVYLYQGTSTSTGWSTSTDAAGNFTFTGLPAGTYYARIFSNFFYVGQLFDGVACPTSCTPSSGKPIAVTVGGTAAGVNFSLTSAGRVTGKVTASDGTPLPGFSVEVINAVGNIVSSVSTDSAGQYQAGGIGAGTYYVRVYASAGYFGELYDNVACKPSCSIATAKSISVAAGATTADVNFALDAGGRIAGKVTDENGLPVSYMGISIYDSTGSLVTSTSADYTGKYITSTPLAAGTYYARTSTSGVYLNQLYSNSACDFGCDVTTGTKITVALASTTNDINFVLKFGGRIRGRLTNAAGQGIPGVYVTAFRSNGVSYASAYADNQGYYQIAGLPGGSYFVRTSASGYLNELYDNLPCTPSCTVTDGKLIAVTAGNLTNNIDFTLDAGAGISGKVTDSSGVGILSATVNIVDAQGRFFGSATTNAAGQYATTSALPGGSYFATTSNTRAFISELFDNITCPGGSCQVSSGTPIAVSGTAYKTGIDFSLATGGRISGKITSKTDGSHIIGSWVEIYNASGAYVTTAYADSSTGVFLSTGLVAGNYFLKTGNNSGFINEAWDDLACFTCNVTIGKPVAVTLGSTTANINFALDVGGRVSGKVTDKDTGKPVSNGWIYLYDTKGNYVTSQYVDTSGTYLTSTALAAGTYYAQTGYFSPNWPEGPNYMNQAYGGVACLPVYCAAVAGSPITVTLGATTPNIDFALSVGGRVAGTVTSSATSTPLANFSVTLYDSSGRFATSAGSIGGGKYATRDGLPPGTYYARTFNSQGLLNELYDNLPCSPSCNVTTGKAIAVTAATTSTADFALDAGGVITGKVTNSATGAGIPNVSVYVYTGTGTFVAGGNTDLSGNYTTGASAVPSGTYYVRTFNSSGYLNELYDNITCTPNCSLVTGKPVAVTAGSTTSNIDFALNLGATITGKVTDSASGAGLANVFVQFYDTVGTFVTSASTNSSGDYVAVNLPTGAFFARTFNAQGYINELYNDTPCVASCSVLLGTAINATVGTTTANINFVLDRGARVGGKVTSDAGTGLQYVGVNVYDANGFFVASGSTAADGTYLTEPGLPTGPYFVRTSGNSGYINELYSDVPCVGSCVLSAGTVVPLSGAATTAVDFKLALGGTISGKVTADDGSLIGFGVSVTAYDATGAFAASASVAGDGTFSLVGLSSGNYFLRTNNSVGYIDERYDNAPCLACAVLDGKAIAVVAGATTTLPTITLTKGGSISGAITDDKSLPLSNIGVRIYNAAGVFVASAGSSSGAYAISTGLPSGTYYATTSNAFGYIDEAYNGGGAAADIICLNCTPTIGVPITVVAGETTKDRDFVLSIGGRISGKVTNGSTPLANVAVTIYSRFGVSLTTAFTNAIGVYTTTVGLPTGSYFSRTSNGLGFIDQRYAGAPCLNCLVTDGTAIAVTAGSTTPNINYDLSAGGRIAGTITGPGGAALKGIFVSVYSGTTFATSAVTNAAGQYTTSGGLPSGNYFVRTSNSLGFIDKLYDNAQCVSCSVNTGTPVAVTAGTTTGNINFSLIEGGRISGTVKDAAGNAAPNITVQIYDAAGVFVTSGFTGTTGGYTTTALPAGNYFARTSNSLGYINQIYNGATGIPCVGTCTVTTGTAIPVAGSSTTGNVNFTLDRGGRISGTVVSGTTPLSGVTVQIYNGAGTFVTGTSTNSLGFYSISLGLPAGKYFARTFNSQGYLNRIYNGLACTSASCNPTLGTAIEVTGTETKTVDFDLPAGGRIAGTVTEDGTAAPLGSVSVLVYSSTGTFITSGFTNTAGQYVTSEGIPPGKYFVVTNNSLGFVNESYDNIACGGYCSIGTGTAVDVSAGATTSNINFALVAGGRFSGTIKSADTGDPLGFVSIDIYTAGGTRVGSAFSGANGQYISAGGLAAGRYYARTSNAQGYIDAQSAEFAVTVGTTTTGIDFSLTRGGQIGGSVRDSSGNPVPGVTVNIYNPSGVFVTSGQSGATGAYLTSRGLAAGTYFARTNNSLGFIDQRYKDTACLGCNPVLGTAITVTGGTVTSGIDFSLELGGRLSGQVVNKDTSAPVANVSILAYSSAGAVVRSTVTDDTGRFEIRGLQAASYFVATRNSAGYIDQIYTNTGGIACPYSAVCSVTTGTAIAITAGAVSSGVNFSLTLGGLVSGTVTDNATTPAPIPNARVTIYDRFGKAVTTQIADSSGRYITSTGLPADTYYAIASADGYLRERYSEQNCYPFCVSTSGAPITVRAGDATTGVNFTLAPGGRIAGVVTDAESATPLSNVQVVVYTSDGKSSITSGISDGSGRYITQNGLAPGSYALRTFNSAGRINEAYDDVVCQTTLEQCLTGIKLVTITAAETASDKNFALAKGGRISGVVKDEASGAPLPSVTVFFYDATGKYTNVAANTDSNGEFIAPASFADGKYFAATRNQLDYVDEAFGDFICVQAKCDVTRTTAITISGGANVTNTNFALIRGGRISGTVKGTASTTVPLPDVNVYVFGSNGLFIASAVTNAAGTFSLLGGLPAGSYYVKTSNALGYVDQVYNGKSCVSCPIKEGDLIAVTAGSTKSGIDFTLVRGGLLSGTVYDGVSGQPLSFAAVIIRDGTGGIVATTTTDDIGVYAVSLPPGRYYVQTGAIAGYSTSIYKIVTAGALIRTAWGNLVPPPTDEGVCPRGLCDIEVGSSIDLGNGESKGRIDLSVKRADCPPITLSPTSLPIGTFGGAYSTTVSASGGLAPYRYTVIDGALPIGLTLNADTGVISGTAAAPGFSTFTIAATDSNSCSATRELTPTMCGIELGAQSTIVTSSSGTGTVGLTLTAADCPWTASASASWLRPSTTSGSGSTTLGFSFDALSSANSRTGLITVNGQSLAVTQQGAPITLTLSPSTLQMLPAAAGTTVQITATPADAPWTAVSNASWLTVSAASGVGTSTLTVTAARNPTVVARTGTVVVSGQTITVTQRANGIPGPPVGLAASVNAFAGTFTWSPPITGGDATGYRLEVGLAPGSTAAAFEVSAPSHTIPLIPPGTYWARARGRNEFGLGLALEEYKLTVSAEGGNPPSPPVNVVAVVVAGRLTLTFDAPSTGAAATGYSLEVGSSPSLSDIATLDIGATRRFTYDGVPNGVYYMRVRARNAAGASDPSREVVLNVGNLPAAPGVPLDLTPTVAGSTVTFNWKAPGDGGAPASYIIEAGTAPGVADIAAMDVGPGTSMTITNVPSGAYFVRLRARNAVGVGSATTDIRLVVP